MSGLYADNKAAQVGVAVSLSILVVANLMGNTLVILIILTNTSMKSPMNYLLVNLAVADIMVGVFLTPGFVFINFFAHPQGFAGKVLCNILTSGSLSWMALVASSLSLAAISIERYFAVVHPFSVRQRLSLMKVKWISSGCWIFALIFNMPTFFIREFDKEKNVCPEQWPENKPYLCILYNSAWLFIVGVLPIIVMLAVYSKVIYTLWFKRNQGQGTQQAVLRSRKRVTKIAVIVSVIYVACIFPSLITYLLHHTSTGDRMQHYVTSYIVTYILTAFNSTINPFIYSLHSQEFRRYTMKILFCYKKRQNCVATAQQ